MGAIGYRQKGDSGPLYNPERDYAYITPTLMTRAIENLDPAALSDEAKSWYAKNNITEADIVKIAEALAEAQRDFVNSVDPVSTFEHALVRRRFHDFNYALRQTLFAAIGEVCCAAWFLAVREVSIVGEESPAQTNMARFVSAVRVFAARNGAPQYDADYAAEHLRMRNDVLQARLQVMYNEFTALQEQLIAARAAAATPAKPKTLWRRFCDYWLAEYPSR